MFRILFIFLVLGLSIYGLFSVFSPLQNTENTNPQNLDFDTYLSEALERNTQKNERVVFYISDFTSEGDSHSEINTNNTDMDFSQNLYPGDDINNYQNSTTTNMIVKVGESSSSSGNFGTPPLPNSNTSRSTKCAGLIFDPCLVLEKSPPATGGMNFGSDRAL